MIDILLDDFLQQERRFSVPQMSQRPDGFLLRPGVVRRVGLEIDAEQSASPDIGKIPLRLDLGH